MAAFCYRCNQHVLYVWSFETRPTSLDYHYLRSSFLLFSNNACALSAAFLHNHLRLSQDEGPLQASGEDANNVIAASAHLLPCLLQARQPQAVRGTSLTYMA